MTYSFLDLFAGVGGFHFALRDKADCLFASELDKNAQITYQLNHPNTFLVGDITDDKNQSLIPKNFDILCGGFPCQAFSIAGLQKGFEDSRGTLFFEIAKIAEKHKPKVLFLENVKNLVSHNKGYTFRTIFSILENLNYKVFFKVLNSATFANIPQNRERLFIVAFNKNKVKNFDNFTFPSQIKLNKNISDCLLSNIKDEKFYYDKHIKYKDWLKNEIVKKNTIYQLRRVYIRENKSNLCPTLTANMGTGGHNVPLILDSYNNRIRKLTPRECFNFQGYNDELKLPDAIPNSALYKQAGNSITLPLVKRIAEEIFNVLDKQY